MQRKTPLIPMEDFFRNPEKSSFSISPNGNLVLYTTKNGTKDVLSGITIDGATKFSLPTISGEVRDPSWSPLFK